MKTMLFAATIAFHPPTPLATALLQEVDNLPSAGASVSPLKVKRATKGQGPAWLMATTYLTSTQETAGRRAAQNSRFQMGQAQP